MAIKVKLEGFDELFTRIQNAGGSINSAAEDCIRKSAEIMESELKSQMQKDGVDSSLINRMPSPKIESSGNRYSAKVGYEATEYNPNNISDYFKAIFLNYGTPHRTKHGKEKSRGFVVRAKRKAKPKIKKQQEETLKEIIREIER